MIELTEQVFIPGAKRWSEVVDLPEHQSIVKLFLFTLGVCVDTRARVFLETVVSDDFETGHQKKLSSMVHVLGYRLWIPLKWVHPPSRTCYQRPWGPKYLGTRANTGYDPPRRRQRWKCSEKG